MTRGRDPYITKEEAAAYLGLSPRTIEDRVHSRSIPFHKVGRLTRFKCSELDAWVDEQTKAAAS